MNKLQQAAKQYASHSDCKYVNDGSPIIDEDKQSAFLAGADYAAIRFAEWVMDNNWHYWGEGNWITNDEGMRTTTELYQLWQQSL